MQIIYKAIRLDNNNNKPLCVLPPLSTSDTTHLLKAPVSASQSKLERMGDGDVEGALVFPANSVGLSGVFAVFVLSFFLLFQFFTICSFAYAYCLHSC